MPEERFEDNLARMVGAVLFHMSHLMTAREMFAKSYYALGQGEKAVVDQTVFQTVAGYYASITPEMLKSQTAQAKAGFQPQQTGATQTK